MNRWMSVNLNSRVRFKFKPAGEKIWLDFYRNVSVNKQPSLPQIKDGWCTTQLWNLMEIFGPHMVIGVEAPIETEIAINYDN